MGRLPLHNLYPSLFSKYSEQNSYQAEAHIFVHRTLSIFKLKKLHPLSTMTVASRPMSIEAISIPSSDINFGAKVENLDVEHLSGKSSPSAQFVD